MSVSIEIENFEPGHQYFGGDTVKGIVILIVKGSQPRILASDFVIRFSGLAEAHWKEQRKHAGPHRQYLITVFDSEHYFDEAVVLLRQDVPIQPGRSEFPFSFQLPLGLPQSYQSEHGKVGYWAEVPMGPLSKWNVGIGEKTKVELKVGAHLDLNCCPREWSQPCNFTMEKDFWSGFGGRVEAQLFLPSRSFVPGESINFTLEVVNKSKCYLKKVRVYFCQVTTYHAKTSEYKEGKRLSKMKYRPVYPRGTATVQGSILVPHVPPTELGGCELVQPQYGIMIKLIATSLGKLVRSSILEGRVPLLIGTVALGQSFCAPLLAAQTTLIRPISVLRRNIEFSQRRVVLTPEEEVENERNQSSFPGEAENFGKETELSVESGFRNLGI